MISFHKISFHISSYMDGHICLFHQLSFWLDASSQRISLMINEIFDPLSILPMDDSIKHTLKYILCHMIIKQLVPIKKLHKWQLKTDTTVQRKIFAGCIFRKFIIRWIWRKEISRIVYVQEATPKIKIKLGFTLSMLDKGNAPIDF